MKQARRIVSKGLFIWMVNGSRMFAWGGCLGWLMAANYKLYKIQCLISYLSLITSYYYWFKLLLIQILSYVVNQISKSNISKVRYNIFRTWTLPFRFKLLLTKSSSTPAALPVWPPIHLLSSLLTKSSVSLSNSLFYFRSTEKSPGPGHSPKPVLTPTIVCIQVKFDSF